MMADNKEQRVCVKFCFLLGKSDAETVLMLQGALSRTQVQEWYSLLLFLLLYYHFLHVEITIKGFYKVPKY